MPRFAAIQRCLWRSRDPNFLLFLINLTGPRVNLTFCRAAPLRKSHFIKKVTAIFLSTILIGTFPVFWISVTELRNRQNGHVVLTGIPLVHHMPSMAPIQHRYEVEKNNQHNIMLVEFRYSTYDNTVLGHFTDQIKQPIVLQYTVCYKKHII